MFWYNHGIDLYPESSFTTRYAYFRDGSLYTLDTKLVDKRDPLLERFVSEEEAHAKKSPGYVAFVDQGLPTRKQIEQFGLSIPEGYYLLLGDNHAMSNDSRFFGAVPESNIQGSPALIFWPPGPRWGPPPQPEIPFFRTPNMIILAFACICISVGTYTYFQRTSIKAYRNLKNSKWNFQSS
jgi:signal peptidase I